MNRPSIPELLKHGESYYSLIIGVSRRARQIVDYANQMEMKTPDNPLADAITDFAKGKYVLVEPEGIGSSK